MDQSKKNAVLFAIIFSVLATGTGLFIVFKPDGDKKTAVPIVNETASSTTPVEPAPAEKKSFFSNFKLPGLFGGTGDDFKKDYMGVEQSSNNSSNQTTTADKQQTTKTPATAQTKTLTPEEVAVERAKQLEKIQKDLETAEKQASQLQIDLNSSPLKGLISISSVSGVGSATTQNEIITLTANAKLPKQTKITGLVFKSTVTGQTVSIGKGVSLPMSNQINTEEDVLINPGDKIYISTGHSPLGYSFKENKCTGYFEQFQNFAPGLTRRCPALRDETLPPPPNNIDDKCFDYINSFPICTIHKSLAFNIEGTGNDPFYKQTHECQVFVENKTGYNTCVYLHKDDSNFRSAIWHLYLGRTLPLWKQKREIIQLVDTDRKLIAQYSY